MGKLKSFTISLNSSREVFYPGEQLAGHVIIDLQEPIEVRGVKVEFEGKGYCQWYQTEGSGENRTTVKYCGKEKLCEINVPLLGMTDGGSRIVLPAGHQTYPFLINIPNPLPSSFEGSIGHIRYTLKGFIDRPGKFDHKFMIPIVINEVIDTNLPKFNMKPGGSAHKDVGCLCCVAGPLDMTGHVDRACYCPGEKVLITADFQNRTTRDMKAVKAKLVRTVRYSATNHSKSADNTKTITKVKGAALPQGEFAKWENQPLDLPAMTPTIMSRVIKVSYSIHLQVTVPWGKNLTMKLPITIGTVPFRPVYGQQLPPTQNQPGVQAAMAPPPPSVLGYADMAPPSYASIAGQSGAVCSEYNVNYNPVYTFAQPSQVPITQQPGGYSPPQDPVSLPPPHQAVGYQET